MTSTKQLTAMQLDKYIGQTFHHINFGEVKITGYFGHDFLVEKGKISDIKVPIFIVHGLLQLV